jgi:hypothetical protein
VGADWNRTFVKNAFLVLLAAAIPMLCAPHRDWKTATLIETTRLEPTRASGVTTNQAYTLDLGDRTIVCADPDMSWVRIRAVPVTVGSQIRYVRTDNSTLLFLDTKGKEHKRVIQHEAIKPTRTQ